MMNIRHYLPLNSFARCLVLSMVLHGIVAALLSLKNSITEITVGGEGSMITATLLPVTFGIPPVPPSSDKNEQKQLVGEPAPTATPQTTSVVVNKTAGTEKKSSKAEQSLTKIVPAPVAQKKSPDSKTLTEQLSVSKAPATGGSVVKKATTPSKTVEKNTKGAQESVQKQSNQAPQPIDLDNFFDALATRQPTSIAVTQSARLGAPDDQQCQQYAAQIKEAIQSNLIKEPSYQGKSCEIKLLLAADGLILQAQLRHGDPGVCAAALRAVKMTGSVPKPMDDRLYGIFKNIVLSFEF